nr:MULTISPECIES: DUF2509 family protein [unclassified Tatumella]
MVLILLLSGTLLLHSSARLLTRGMAGAADESQYLQDFYQAQSSLAWGERQSWPDNNGWQCRRVPVAGGYSCLLWQTADSGLLLGQSRNAEKQIWRIIRRAFPDQPQIMAVAGGWTDLCPLADEKRCTVSVAGVQPDRKPDSATDPVPRGSDVIRLPSATGDGLSATVGAARRGLGGDPVAGR